MDAEGANAALTDEEKAALIVAFLHGRQLGGIAAHGALGNYIEGFIPRRTLTLLEELSVSLADNDFARAGELARCFTFKTEAFRRQGEAIARSFSSLQQAHPQR